MIIGVDAMGGDYAPLEAIKGVLLARQVMPDADLVLFGNQTVIQDVLVGLDQNPSDFNIVHAPENIEMGEHAVRAVTQKKESGINIGMGHLAHGKIDAFISAGNTGAVYVSSLYHVKAIEGIQRPAITSIVPKPTGNNGVLLDVGANSDCKPEVLEQFGLLGSLFSKLVFKIESPKVGLLNIGEEEEKGNILTQAAFQILKESQRFNFVGNVEARDLFSDKSDVVVCDGFTGNVIVKVCEGLYYNLAKRGVQDEYLDKFNFKHYGGSPILGINKPVIIGHGISKAETFVKMIQMGYDVHYSQLIEKIKTSF